VTLSGLPLVGEGERSLPNPVGSPARARLLISRAWRVLDRSEMGRFWLVAGIVLIAQFAGLLLYSAFLYHRFDLTDDFATYSQAWWLIGHGHINPVDTVQAPPYPFWQSHFELAMWPVAWIGRLWPNPLSLLWLQDLALVSTEFIALLWIGRLSSERLSKACNLVPAVAAIVLVGNVWWFETASFDIHFETLGLPFVMMAGYSMWRGRFRSALVAAVLGVLFGDVVSISILLVGLAALLSRRVRRQGGIPASLALVGIGVVWLVLISLLNANRGSGLVTNYGYLVNAGPHASSGSVVRGLILHPGHPLHVLFNRWHAIGRVIGSSLVIGVLTPWGLLLALGTTLPAALNVNPQFIAPINAFQTLVAVPFVFVGALMVLFWLGTGRGERATAPSPGSADEADSVAGAARRRAPVLPPWRPIAALGVFALLGVLPIVQNFTLFTQLRVDWWKVDASSATTLATVSTVPATTEVIVSQGVIGRFADRPYVYPYLVSPQAFPVRSRSVLFVLTAQGIESVPPGRVAADAGYLRAVLHARVITDQHGVAVLLWHPPPRTSVVVLP
jgi:hypothetical protein